MRKRRLLLSILIVFGALVYLGYVGYRESALYYYTVSEASAQAQAGRLGERRLRVLGDVVTGSVEYDPARPLLRFRMTEGGSTVVVTYSGLKPDLFEAPGAQAVVEGRFLPDGTFAADNLMVKCPSKYESTKSGG